MAFLSCTLQLMIVTSTLMCSLCHEETTRLLLISFDGFRSDYLDIVRRNNGTTPNFDRLISGGVTVAQPGVTNAFLTKTLPDHQTIVTGLYEEDHGIVANDFYDPTFNESYDPFKSKDIKWWTGTGLQKVVPIWVTNEDTDEDRASGVCMWWGCDVIGQTPKYFRPYNGEVPFEDRADDIVKWFTLKKNPINFGVLYMNEPDHTGHLFGPESIELVRKVMELDKNLGYLLEKLEKYPSLHGLNIIVTSDHGMEPLKDKIYLNDYIDSSLYSSYGGSPVRHIVPNAGSEPKVYEQLLKVDRAKVYKKEELPESLRYKNNRRVAPLLLVADPGILICDNRTCGSALHLKGDHGWFNSLPSMHPIFIAHGPAFKKNYVAAPFETVNIYPLMCHLLEVTPRPNNGSLGNIKHILSDGDNLNITMISFILSIGFAALVSGVMCIGACRSHRYSRRKRIEGKWKPLPLGTMSKTTVSHKPLLINDDEDELA